MSESDVTRSPAIVVTGPTRGLGLETVRALVRAAPDLDVVLVGRSSADMALGRGFADARGGYVDIDELGRPSEESFDPAREVLLWQRCVELAGSPRE